MRLGLENIKMRQTLEMASSGKINDKRMLKSFNREIGNYIAKALNHEKERRMHDVYITDHVP